MPTKKSQLTMNSILTHLYYLIWLILHTIVLIYETLYWLIFRLHAAMQWSHDRLHNRCTVNADREHIFLERCKAELSKIPKHLSIIIGPNEKYVNEELLKRLFTYSLLMDICYVTVYDTRSSDSGKVSLKNIEALDEQHAHHFVWNCAAKKPVFSEQQQPVNNGTTNAFKNGHCAVNGYKRSTNGAAKGHKVHEKLIEILEISNQHGRSQIAEVCRSLFEKRHTVEVQTLLKDHTLLTQRIDAELSRCLYNFPESELCIIFNSDMCTFGMLPWQTRFTEFQLHEMGRHFDAKAFAKVLYRYSRIEQRWGK